MERNRARAETEPELEPTREVPAAAMRVSAEEWAAGALSDDKIEELVASFDERGLFVLENVVPKDGKCSRSPCVFFRSL